MKVDLFRIIIKVIEVLIIVKAYIIIVADISTIVI